MLPMRRRSGERVATLAGICLLGAANFAALSPVDAVIGWFVPVAVCLLMTRRGPLRRPAVIAGSAVALSLWILLLWWLIQDRPPHIAVNWVVACWPGAVLGAVLAGAWANRKPVREAALVAFVSFLSTFLLAALPVVAFASVVVHS